MTTISERTGSCAIGRTARALLLVSAAACAVAVGGCRESLRIDDFEAARLDDPTERHPIGFGVRTEALFVEMAGKGEGLSGNQRSDVFRFVEAFKSESRGSLRISAPGSASGHLAVSRSFRDVLDIVQEAGIPERFVDIERHGVDPDGQFGPAIEIAYQRQVAVAPECGNWPEDLGRNRERLHFENYGCASQRNLALTVANARDLQGPQMETPRSSERRSVTWTKYLGSGGSGSAMSPTDRVNSSGAGADPSGRPGASP